MADLGKRIYVKPTIIKHQPLKIISGSGTVADGGGGGTQGSYWY